METTSSLQLEQYLRAILGRQGILVGHPVPIKDCILLKEYLLDKNNLSREGSVIPIAVPYRPDSCENEEIARNISLYAVSEDYHRFFAALFEKTESFIRTDFPGVAVKGFADHSPIAEVHATALSGIGVVGKNHLLITKEYGSFVFLGEFITSLPCPALSSTEVPTCTGCDACQHACPAGGDMSACLSALSQKKGDLSPLEEARLIAAGSLWGCDICQLACPLNRDVQTSRIPFFRENRIANLTKETLDSLDEEQFSRRAFSWRGKKVPERNIALFQEAQNTPASSDKDSNE
ncbi:MAG: DUF1730 domain-containing protein [Clostridia bacterium]|nr:DUF1730 domain-containing protein [Clostridia bacterium]